MINDWSGPLLEVGSSARNSDSSNIGGVKEPVYFHVAVGGSGLLPSAPRVAHATYQVKQLLPWPRLHAFTTTRLYLLFFLFVPVQQVAEAFFSAIGFFNKHPTWQEVDFWFSFPMLLWTILFILPAEATRADRRLLSCLMHSFECWYLFVSAFFWMILDIWIIIHDGSHPWYALGTRPILPLAVVYVLAQDAIIAASITRKQMIQLAVLLSTLAGAIASRLQPPSPLEFCFVWCSTASGLRESARYQVIIFFLKSALASFMYPNRMARIVQPIEYNWNGAKVDASTVVDEFEETKDRHDDTVPSVPMVAGHSLRYTAISDGTKASP